MTTHVALLRAVNVGGRSIKMADLVALFADLGFAGARTYLKSGNVVFDAGKADRRKVAARIEAGIEERFGFRSEAILRSGAEFAKLIAKNPFPDMATEDPRHLLVMFLAGAPTRDDKAALAMEWDGPETWRLVGSDLFIAYPAGIGKSKLKLKLKTPGTGRNWNVVNALAEMANA
jgi:uncharacterized protein (DUF1697 family)